VFKKYIILFCCISAFFIDDVFSLNEAKDTKNSNNNGKIELADDSKLISLMDDKQKKVYISHRKIAVNTKDRGVPSICLKLPKKKSIFFVKENRKLKYVKSNLKQHIEKSLIANDVSPKLIKYIKKQLKYNTKTIKKHKEFVSRKMVDFIDRYNIPERVKVGKLYKKMYKQTLLEVENLFKTDPNILLTIWAMETKYGDFIGNYNAFSALYSACINAETEQRLRYFEKNIIYLAVLVDHGYFEKDVLSSFDGGLGGCQFMPESFYSFGISLDKRKANIINDNKDVLSSIGNYLHSNGWRYKEGILTEVILPDNFDPCLIGMNTVKSIKEWKKLGVELHNNKIGTKHAKNEETNVSIIVLDPDDYTNNIAKKRAFFVYDNYKVIMSYNPRLAYGLTAGLIFECIGE